MARKPRRYLPTPTARDFDVVSQELDDDDWAGNMLTRLTVTHPEIAAHITQISTEISLVEDPEQRGNIAELGFLTLFRALEIAAERHLRST